MGAIDSYLINQMENDVKNLNITKNLVLSKLYSDGIITKEKYNEYNDNYQVIVVKKSWFKNFFDRVTGDTTGYVIKFVDFR